MRSTLDSACADFPDGLGETDGLLGRYLHDHPHDVATLELDRPLSGLSQAAVLTRAPYQESRPLLGASCVLGSSTAWDKALTATPFGMKRLGLWIFGTMIPSCRNYLRLDSRTKGEFGLPSLDVHIRYDAAVRHNMAAARERLVAMLESAGYPCRVEPSVPTLVPGLAVHYGGTVRMHRSKKYGC